MEIQSEDQRVVDIVKRHWAQANIRNVEIHKVHPRFAQGPLYYVSIYDANGAEHENFVHVTRRGDILYQSLEELVIGVNEEKPLSFWETGLSFIRLSGIPGVLAILITTAVCVIAVQKTKDDIPDLLGNALMAILGFYFSTVARTVKPLTKRPRKP